MTLQDLMQLLGIQQQSPFYNAQQVGGQGVLGQGLAQQQQAIDAASSGQPQQAQPPQAPQAPLPPTPPQSRIRQGFQLLNPEDWTPEERALFRRMHNIQQPQSGWSTIADLFSGLNRASAQPPR
jgi:hypothetical protein